MEYDLVFSRDVFMSKTVHVEAKDEAEAWKKAEEMIKQGLDWGTNDVEVEASTDAINQVCEA